MVELLDVPGIRDQPIERLRRFARLLRSVGSDPALVGAVIGFESGWDRTARNPHSSAVGLIQWTTSGAGAQGLEREQIAAMGTDAQIDLVAEWYGRHNTAGWRVADYYLAVFAPDAIGKPLSAVVYSAPSKAYEQNAALDADGDGVISVGDIVSKFGGFVAAADRKPRIAVDASIAAPVVAALVAATLLGGGLYAERRRWV